MHPVSTGSKVDSVPPLRIVAVIPARYASTRLPGKVLADLDGRPMIEHVYRRAKSSRAVSEVVVATDDLRVATRVIQASQQSTVADMSSIVRSLTELRWPPPGMHRQPICAAASKAVQKPRNGPKEKAK